MAKIISLTKGKTTLVDDDDYKWVCQWKWYFHTGGYAARTQRMPNGKRVTVRMHRQVMQDPYRTNGMDVDHVNLNRLDNRRANLRFCTRGENVQNSPKRSDNNSGYKGVSYNKLLKKWTASIHTKDIKLWKHFKSPVDAAKQYDQWAKEIYGEFARMNFT